MTEICNKSKTEDNEYSMFVLPVSGPYVYLYKNNRRIKKIADNALSKKVNKSIFALIFECLVVLVVTGSKCFAYKHVRRRVYTGLSSCQTMETDLQLEAVVVQVESFAEWASH